MIKYTKPDPKNRSAQVLRSEKKSRKPDKRLAAAKPKPHRQGRAKH